MQNQTVIKTSWSDEFDEKFELESQGCSECGGFELIDKTEIRYPESEYHCEFDLDKVKSFISKVEKEAEERAYQRAVEEIKKSFEKLDEVEQSYPMAIINWSKKDRENWILSLITKLQALKGEEIK